MMEKAIKYLSENGYSARCDDYLTVVVSCKANQFERQFNVIKRLLSEVGWNKTFRVVLKERNNES